MVTTTVQETVRPAPAPPARRRYPWTVAALALCVASGAVWMATAVRAAGHGLDITDEGFYLLSYRWWSVEHRTFTGAQYLYGPVFQLLGYDIAALRIFRLLTVVGTHLVFGWSVMSWLRPRRPAAPPTRLWEAAGTAAIVAAGGAVYGWLPQTPGYNDVALLGGMLGMALVLRMARHVDRGARVPARLPLALGALAVPVLLAKWTAAPLLLVVIAAAVVALRPQGPRAVARAAAWAVAAVPAVLAVVHVALVPLSTVVPELLAVNRQLSDSGGRGLAVLLTRYWETTAPTLTTVAGQHGPLLVAAVVAVAWRRRAGWAVAAAGAGLSLWYAVRAGGLGGGRLHLFTYVGTLLLVVIFALVVALAVGFADRRAARVCALTADGTRGRLLLGTLVLLPVLQALGTNNPPLVNVVNGFAVWLAVLVAVLTGMETAPRAARALTAGVAAAAVVATAGIATGGLWRHPYRQAANDVATAAVPGVPALASVTLDPATAAQYSALRRALEPWLQAPGRPVMAFDTMAGLVLVLDGRPVGEAWYPARDAVRTAAGIVAECDTEGPWTGAGVPLLLFNRPVQQAEIRVLRRCGLTFGTAFRRLEAPGAPDGLRVYVPTGRS